MKYTRRYLYRQRETDNPGRSPTCETTQATKSHLCRAVFIKSCLWKRVNIQECRGGGSERVLLEFKMSGCQAIIGATHQNTFCNHPVFLPSVPLVFRLVPHPNPFHSGRELKTFPSPGREVVSRSTEDKMSGSSISVFAHLLSNICSFPI